MATGLCRARVLRAIRVIVDQVRRPRHAKHVGLMAEGTTRTGFVRNHCCFSHGRRRYRWCDRRCGGWRCCRRSGWRYCRCIRRCSGWCIRRCCGWCIRRCCGWRCRRRGCRLIIAVAGNESQREHQCQAHQDCNVPRVSTFHESPPSPFPEISSANRRAAKSPETISHYPVKG